MLLASTALAQWTKIPVPTTAGFRGLSVVSENVVWASGTDGTVIRTIDGGKHWSVITVPGAEKLDFRSIKAFDDQTAVIISSGPAEKGQAQIYRTTDGGKTWKQVFEEKRAGIFFDAVAFWDAKHGIVLSDPIDGKFALFTTEDGGLTWKQLPPDALPAALPNEGAFAASNSCLTIQGTSNVWFATGGATVARVFRSSDRGKNWAVAETPMHPANASSGIFSLAFHDERRGIGVGGDYAHPEKSEVLNVVVTIDGGKSWRAGGPTVPPGMYLSSVLFEPDTGSRMPSQTGMTMAVGAAGMQEAEPGSPWHNPAHENFNAAAFSAPDVRWAVGPGGGVFREKIYGAYTDFSSSGGAYTEYLISKQLLVVTTPAWNISAGNLNRYERDSSGVWKIVGKSTPVVLAKNGLAPTISGPLEPAQKQHGDARSPAGVFPIHRVLGTSHTSPAPRMPYESSEGVECVDDPGSFSYGGLLRRDQVAFSDWNSAQPLMKYESGIIVVARWREWGRFSPKPNEMTFSLATGEKKVLSPDPPPGACMFLFGSAAPLQPTEGSTAIPQKKFDEILRWLDAGKNPVLVQLPVSEYDRLKSFYKFP